MSEAPGASAPSAAAARIPQPDVSIDRLNNGAVAAFEQGKLIEAIALWEEALAMEPGHPETLYNHAIVQWRQGKIAVGEVLRRLALMEAEPGRKVLPLAYTHLERRAPDEAGRVLSGPGAGPVTDPDGAIALALGHALMCQGIFPAALGAYEAVLRQRPGDRAATIGAHLAAGRRRTQGDLTVFPLAQRIRRLGEGDSPCDVTALALSPDGRLAVAGFADHALQVVNLRDASLLARATGHTGCVTHVAIRGDSRLVVSAGADGTVRSWSLPAATPERVMEGHTGPVTGLAFAPESQTVVSSGLDGTARVWDLPSGSVRAVLRGHPGPITGLTLLPGDRFLATVSGDRADGSLRIWDLEAAQCVKVWAGLGLAGRVTAIPGAAGGLVLLFGDDVLAIGDLVQGRCVRALAGHCGRVDAAAITRDGARAVTLEEDDTLRVYQIDSGECKIVIRGRDGAQALALLPGDQHVLLAPRVDRALVAWELVGEPGLLHAPLLPTRVRSDVELADLGVRFRDCMLRAHEALEGGNTAAALVGLNDARAVPGFGHAPEALDMVSGFAAAGHARGLKAIRRAASLALDATDVLALALDLEGSCLMAGDVRGQLMLWAIESGERLRTIPAHRSPLTCVIMLADGLRAITATSASLETPSGAEAPVVWDLETGQPAVTLQDHPGPVQTIALAAGGSVVVSGVSSDRVLVHALDSGRLQRVYEGRPGPLLATSSSGRLALSSAGQGDCVLWDLKTGARVRTLKGHSQRVTVAAIAHDERFVLTASLDGTIRLWDAQKGTTCLSYEGSPAPVSTLALTLDETFFLATGEDSRVRAWRIDEAQCIQEYPLPAARVRALAADPSGRRCVVNGLAQGVVHLSLDWDIDVAGGAPPAGARLRLSEGRGDAVAVDLRSADPDRALLFPAETLEGATRQRDPDAIPFLAGIVFLALPIATVLAGCAALWAAEPGLERNVDAALALVLAITCMGVWKRRRWARWGCIVLVGLTLIGFLAAGQRAITSGKTPDLSEPFTRLMAIPFAAGGVALALGFSRDSAMGSGPMSPMAFGGTIAAIMVGAFMTRTPIGQQVIEEGGDVLKVVVPKVAYALFLGAPPTLALLALIALCSSAASRYFHA